MSSFWFKIIAASFSLWKMLASSEELTWEEKSAVALLSDSLYKAKLIVGNGLALNIEPTLLSSVYIENSNVGWIIIGKSQLGDNGLVLTTMPIRSFNKNAVGLTNEELKFLVFESLKTYTKRTVRNLVNELYTLSNGYSMIRSIDIKSDLCKEAAYIPFDNSIALLKNNYHCSEKERSLMNTIDTSFQEQTNGNNSLLIININHIKSVENDLINPLHKLKVEAKFTEL